MRNADALLTSARYYVRTDENLDRSFETARVRCKKLAAMVGDLGLGYCANEPAAIQANELALLSLQELEQRLADSRPSKEAVKLGVEW